MSGYSAPRPISEGDETAAFDSGEPSLDIYLRTLALANHVAGASQHTDPVPVILLSRLAVDRQGQGKGLGAHLLRDAITRSVAAADLIGVRAMRVHALHDEARAFYTHFDFEPSPTDPLHLLLLIKDARALLGG